MDERQLTNPVPFLRAEFPTDVLPSMESVLRSGYVGCGPLVDAFEREIASYLAASFVVSTSSCTAALSLSYADIDVKPDTVVLTTPMTCAATNIPLLHASARIVWLDVDPLLGNVTPETLAMTLKAHSDARVAVVVDWAGTPCDYDGLAAVADRYGVPLVLDAAQSFGSLYRDALCPRTIDYVCYSFGPTKILSSVEGGAVVVRSESAAKQLRAARWYGIDRARRDPTSFWEYDVVHAGHRYTSNDVFASIGSQMLRRLPGRLAVHRSLAALYRRELNSVHGVTLPPTPESTVPNYWMFTIHVEKRPEFLRTLHGARAHVATPHNRNDHLTCFVRTAAGDLPGLDAFNGSYVCLPIGPWVREEDAYAICDVIRRGW